MRVDIYCARPTTFRVVELRGSLTAQKIKKKSKLDRKDTQKFEFAVQTESFTKNTFLT